jgi:hypothetical protein
VKESHRRIAAVRRERTTSEGNGSAWIRNPRRGDGVSTRLSSVACLALLIPDRFPSLVVLVGFWIPPAVAGWVAAGFAQGNPRRSAAATYSVLAIFVLVYAAAWFFYNLGRMPPYIPGALTDPAVATPRAVAGLALVASVLVLPGSALACVIAFRLRRLLSRPSDGSA